MIVGNLMSDDKKDPDKNEYSGFLVLLMKVGHKLYVGDSVIVVNEINHNTVKLAIKAKRHVLIRKTP